MPSTTPIPPYSKWYTPTPVAARTATSATPIAPGDVLADGHENRNQAPPTQGTSWEVERSFLVPWTTDEAGELKELLAKLELRYRVEDWGEVLLDGKRIIDMTPMVEKPTGSHGGHSVWTRRVNCLLSSGAHTLLFRYTNIAMDNPNNNQIIFEYDYRVVALEPGGVPMPEMCDCAGDTCSLEGGFPAAAAQAEGDGEEEGNNSPSGSVPSDSSSAGSSVQRGLGDDYAYWSCNMGTLRGLGALLTGHLQLRAATAGADLASPAALAFEHPLAAQLRLPAGGIVPGARLELQFGQRVIALRYYSDGVLAPIGVDSAGGGVATLLHDEDERVVAMRWQDGSEAQWQFDAATGELQAYTAPNGVCLSPIPELLSVRRSADGRYIRQIESPWDGLADIGNITSEGYTISLYTPARITGHDADGYAIPEPGSAYKSFVVRYAAGELSISEQSPEHPEYRCAWSQGDGGAWCMSEGSGEEAVVTERSLSTPESADTGAYAVRQRITTQRRGSAVASCVCELFQESPMGPLVLTRVEGYGSDAARTTQFEYDAVGNCTAQVAPGGHRTEYAYDSTGRLTRQSEPWHGDAGTLITYFYYSEGEGSSYRDTPSAQAVWLSPAGGELMQLLRRERYLRSEQDGVRREELRRSATGAAQERLSITERWIESAENPLARGRLRLTQGEDGVQTHYSYAATAQHGALYSMIRETKVAGAAVPGQSRRRVAYIGAAGNTLREEEYLLLSDGATWALLSGATHSYDTQNRRIGTQRDNGRNSSRTLNCTGAPLRETDENGITTTYSYDSARQLIESTRAAVYEGERCITPETITGYTRDAAGRILSERRDIGPLISIRTTQYDLLGRPIAQTDELGRTTTTTYSADGLTTCVTTPAGATLITEQHADGSLARRHGSAQREQRYVYGMQEGCLSESIRDGTTLLSQRLSDGFGQIVAEIAPTTLSNTSICTRSSYNARGQLI
ncbi:MAG: sugar-binding protein, partial [Akkermansia sp.]